MSLRPLLVAVVSIAVLIGAQAQTVVFSDNFDAGHSPQWDNAVGNWSASGGTYNAAAPNNLPPTFSGLPFVLTDFSISVRVNAASDGGLWLRAADNQNGVLLVTGGHGLTGTGLYWHIAVNGNYGAPQNEVSGLFVNGVSNLDLTVVVTGDTYSAYLNGSPTPVTTLTTSQFTSGRVGLYDYSGQTFDNFVVSVPEPSTWALAGLGLVFAATSRRWRKRAA